MIIKFFGQKDDESSRPQVKSKGGGPSQDDTNEKMEFINIVEPLTILMSKARDHGVRITALAIMAVVNMCNYTEDIKQIFLLKKGFQLVLSLMDSKDESILLNTLRLIMVLITSRDKGND